jgi:nitrous oxidase accessory protein NosD
MTRLVLTLLFAVLLGAGAHAQPKLTQIFLVGPQRAYKLPSEAIRIARPGDLVRIDPGNYVDCAYVTAAELTIEGAADGVTLRDKSCGDKGILVVVANDVTIRHLTLSGAAGPSKNNAGIRVEGANLTVAGVRFLDNENGILANARDNSRLVVANSHFERNGKCEPQCAHAIYVNRIDYLRVVNSTFVDQRIGHHIKSRATYTEIIDNKIEDGPNGTASYLIDIANGGSATIFGNDLHKGPLSANRSTAIAIGAEGGASPNASYRIAGNRFINDSAATVAFVRNFTSVPAFLNRNTIINTAIPLTGPGVVEP